MQHQVEVGSTTVPDWIWITALIALVLAFFTDFYGLGTIWQNRGSWYRVYYDEIPTVMAKLYALHAFKDSDGLLEGHIKVRVEALNYDGDVCYRVKVPNWVFKDLKCIITEEMKRETLGLHR